MWKLVDLTRVDCNKSWQKATTDLAREGSKDAGDALVSRQQNYLLITK
jgi:hypothetical protein